MDQSAHGRATSQLTKFAASVHDMASIDAPMPEIAAVVAVIMALFVGLAVAVGFTPGLWHCF